MKKLIILAIAVVLIFTLFTGCTKKKEPVETPQEPEKPQEQQTQYEEKEILLFYPDQNSRFLLHEFRKVTVDKDIELKELAQMVLEELIKGTDNSELKSIVPRDAKVLSLDLKGTTATVDLSEEFAIGKYSKKEKLLEVFSVVNTLTELGIEEVNILINGNPVTDYYTSLNLEMPFVRNDELIPSK